MVTMRENRNAFVLAVAAFLLYPCADAQMEPCPSNRALTGYASIAAMNNDIDAEFNRIQNGGAPQEEYVYMFCPRQEYDASIEPLRPLLSGSVFRCGVTGLSTDTCTITGGSEQIRVEDSGLTTFPLSNVAFRGLTFNGFTNNADSSGTSVNVLASDATSIAFSDVVWTGFDSEFVISQQTAEDGTAPATVTVENARVTNGDAAVVFENNGGSLTIIDSVVDGVTVDSVISSSNSADSKLEGSTIQSSSVSSVTRTASGSVQEVTDTTVTNMSDIEDVFIGTGTNTRVTLTGVTVESNVLPSARWRVLNARNGATGNAIRSTVRSNAGLEFAFVVATSPSVMLIDDCEITDNSGIGPARTSSLVISLNAAVLSIEGTQFSGNTAFTSQALAFFRSFIAIQQSCFRDSDSTFVVFVDDDSTYSGTLNFVHGNVDSTSCPAPGNRLFKEDSGGECFLGGDCEGQCQVLATSDECLAFVDPTSTPTVSPTVNTTAPTFVPTSSPGVTLSPTNGTGTSAPTAPSTRAPTSSPVLLPPASPPTSIPTTRPSPVPTTRAPITSPPTRLPTTGAPSARCPGAKLVKQPKYKPKTKLSMFARSGSRKKMTKYIRPKHTWHTDTWYNYDAMPGSDGVASDDSSHDAKGEENDGYYYFYVCPPTDPPTSESKGKGKWVKSSKKSKSKKMQSMKGSGKGSGKGSKKSSSKSMSIKGKGKSRRAQENSQERRPGL